MIRGLREIGRTGENVIYTGGLADCRRAAFVGGLDIERYEGGILGSEGGIGIYRLATPETFAIAYFRGGGLIVRGADDFTLVLPIAAEAAALAFGG